MDHPNWPCAGACAFADAAALSILHGGGQMEKSLSASNLAQHQQVYDAAASGDITSRVQDCMKFASHVAAADQGPNLEPAETVAHVKGALPSLEVDAASVADGDSVAASSGAVSVSTYQDSMQRRCRVGRPMQTGPKICDVCDCSSSDLDPVWRLLGKDGALKVWKECLTAVVAGKLVVYMRWAYEPVDLSPKGNTCWCTAGVRGLAVRRA